MNSTKPKSVIFSIILAASGLLTSTATAADDDQAAWSAVYQNSCANTQLRINYIRVNAQGLCRRNLTTQRDGELMDNASKYWDGVKIGNTNGSSNTTLQVSNLLSSTTVKAWSGLCYSGTGFSISAGSIWMPSSQNNLRSLAGASITACGQA